MAQVAALNIEGLSFSERLRVVNWAANMGKCPTIDDLMGVSGG